MTDKYLRSGHRSDFISGAQFVMNVVAELHRLGYGRLKLFAYLSSIGAWRHALFASGSFPNSVTELPDAHLFGSYPWLAQPTVEGKSVQAAARRFIKRNPDIAEQALGRDDFYVTWYKWALKIAGGHGVMEMESPLRAQIGSHQYKLVTVSVSQPTPIGSSAVSNQQVFALRIDINSLTNHLRDVCAYVEATGAPVIVTDRPYASTLILVTEGNREFLERIGLDSHRGFWD